MDNIPGLIHTEETEEAAALQFLEGLRIKSSDSYHRPRYTLYQNGVGFAPLGNLAAICAERKSGKSWVMLQLCLALLRPDGCYGDLRCGEDIGKSVLWLDTEQDKYDTMLTLRRVQQECGWGFADDPTQFRILNLRSLGYEERFDVLGKAVKAYRPSVVMLDGARDLVSDFNDQAESFSLIEEEMRLTEQYDCVIWNVIHVNPNTVKMRGHLGTEFANKSTDGLVVNKHKDGGKVTFAVEHLYSRHRDIDGWTFEIDDDKPYSVPRLVGGSLAGASAISEATEDDRQMLSEVMGIRAMSKRTLLAELKAHYGIGTAKVSKLITRCLDYGLLEMTIDNKLRLVGKAINGEENEDNDKYLF